MCHGDRLTAPRVATPGPPLRHRCQAATNGALSRPGRSGSPAAVLVEQCVGQHEERAHDDDHRDLPRRSLRDELTIRRAQVRVVPGRRQCRHVEQPPRPRPSAGIWVSRPAAVTRDTPGIDVRISGRRASPSSTASRFPIAVSMATRCWSS